MQNDKLEKLTSETGGEHTGLEKTLFSMALRLFEASGKDMVGTDFLLLAANLSLTLKTAGCDLPKESLLAFSSPSEMSVSLDCLNNY